MRSKTLLLVLAGIIFIAQCPAQPGPISYPVSGTLYDSASLAPIANASVNIKSVSGNFSKNGISGASGGFRFAGIPPGKYRVTVMTLNFNVKEIDVDLSRPDTGGAELGSIMLSRKPVKELKAVVVTADKPLIRQEIDRIIYDVQADPESRIQNALDVLRKAPLVSVSADDEIQLKGNSNFRILINGRTSSLVARSPKDALKVMPASLIERIEIITHPPAKYDAEGLGGIINIVTRKNGAQGYSGAINASYGELNSAINESITAKIGKLGFSGFAGNSREKVPASPFNNSLSVDSGNKTNLVQDGIKRYNGHSMIGSVQLSYEFDSLDLVTAAFGSSYQIGTNYSGQVTNLYNAGGSSTQSYFLDRNSDRRDNGTDISVNYERGFKKNKQYLLTFSYNYSASKYRQNSQSLISNPVNYSGSDLLQLNNLELNEQTLQADYVHPMKKVRIDGGFKVIYRTSFSDFSSQDWDKPANQYVVDTSNSQNFNYTQKIYSLYNSYLFTLGKLGVAAGLRLERTETVADFKSTNTALNEGYQNLIPSLTMKRNFKNNSSISLGYTQRMQRPAIWQLNPFVDKSNTSFYFSGNPGLRPVRNHSVSLDYYWFKKGFFSASLGYSFSTNSIQALTSGKGDSISYSSYFNIGRNKNLTLNISLNYPLARKLNLTLNGIASYLSLEGKVNDLGYHNTGIQGNVYTYLTYRLKKGYIVALNGGFYSPTVLLQGSSTAYVYYSISGRKNIFKDKVTLSASVTNPFNKFRVTKSTLQTPDFSQIFRNDRYVRNFAIGIGYLFGKLQPDAIKRNKRSIKNDDTKKTFNKEEGNQ